MLPSPIAQCRRAGRYCQARPPSFTCSAHSHRVKTQVAHTEIHTLGVGTSRSVCIHLTPCLLEILVLGALESAEPLWAALWAGTEQWLFPWGHLPSKVRFINLRTSITCYCISVDPQGPKIMSPSTLQLLLSLEDSRNLLLSEQSVY